MSAAQHELAREYGFGSWPKLVRYVQAGGLEGIERALVLADAPALSALLHADPAAATAEASGLLPLVVLLRRTIGSPADVRRCAQLLLDAGADLNLPWHRWDVGRQPLALAARCGHLAAYELLASRGATADLDPVDAAVLAVARGESVRLPRAAPPALGNPAGKDYGWILGQFALLGRTDVVQALLDSGLPADTRGWSNFTPLDQAAMHGRTETVRLLIARGADLHDCAFDAEGPTPLDCALWGLQNNRAEDGDYLGTVEALLAAGAPTQHSPPTGDDVIDALLAKTADG
ncbi:MAG: ankyrin repeat domain-containing protein [Pseudonocardiaceae bacterium]